MKSRVNLVRDEGHGTAPCIPVYVLGEGKMPLPLLRREQAISLVRIILMDEAKRSVPRGQRSNEPIRSEFVSYAGSCSWRRGSDLVERVYAAMEVLKRSGVTEKEASLEVAAMLGLRLGNSGRGRHQKSQSPRGDFHQAEIVRALDNDFKNRHPWKEKLPANDPIVEKWYSFALSISAWAEEVAAAKEKLLENYPISQKLLPFAEGAAAWAKNLLPLSRILRSRTAKRTVLSPGLPRIPKGWRPSGILTLKDVRD